MKIKIVRKNVELKVDEAMRIKFVRNEDPIELDVNEVIFADYGWSVKDVEEGCRSSGQQNCHECPNFACGDNLVRSAAKAQAPRSGEVFSARIRRASNPCPPTHREVLISRVIKLAERWTDRYLKGSFEPGGFPT